MQTTAGSANLTLYLPEAELTPPYTAFYLQPLRLFILLLHLHHCLIVRRGDSGRRSVKQYMLLAY